VQVHPGLLAVGLMASDTNQLPQTDPGVINYPCEQRL